VVAYFEMTARDAVLLGLQVAGTKFMQLPLDERWLRREARLEDRNNNVLCLYQAGENRKQPPWRLKD
jgi:hypothetical protein